VFLVARNQILSPWPASKPAIQQAKRLRADDSYVLANAGTLDGRVKPCHGELILSG
jgi:hypothetical protein